MQKPLKLEEPTGQWQHFLRVPLVAACLSLIWLATSAGAADIPSAGDEPFHQLLGVLRQRGAISEQEYRNLSRLDRSPKPTAQGMDGTSLLDRITGGERAIQRLETSLNEQTQAVAKLRQFQDGTSSELVRAALKDRWYERFSLRGYVQFRFNHVFRQEGPELDVPADRSVREAESFLIRRGRLILSGDISERLFLYVQPDFNSSVGGTGDSGLQMRDLYADLSLDDAREWRVRAGQSKIPYGWVNLQSSQNRGPLERPDALNSGVESERDVGIYVMWAPTEARQRFRDLVRLGLKGSGDYGVATVGAYAGQGPNRSDLNGEPHILARLSYPFKLASGQFFELGIHGYHGRFVSPVSAIGTPAAVPAASAGGVVDRRVGVTAIWYPQPFGVEAEWTAGEGPELSPDFRSITSRFLHGGYVQLNWRPAPEPARWFPFLRWNYYDGGRKFGANAPADKVNELDVGTEWSPWPAVELTVVYGRVFERSNTRAFPYLATRNADRVGVQLQFNF